jgi:transposase
MPRHFAVLDLHVTGMSMPEIAKALSIGLRTVEMTVASPIYQDELLRRREKIEGDKDYLAQDALLMARRRIAKASLRASEVQVDLLEEDDPRIRQKAASEILRSAFDGSGGSGQGNSGPAIILQGPAIINLMQAIREDDKEFVDVTEGSGIEDTSPVETQEVS